MGPHRSKDQPSKSARPSWQELYVNRPPQNAGDHQTPADEQDEPEAAHAGNAFKFIVETPGSKPAPQSTARQPGPGVPPGEAPIKPYKEERVICTEAQSDMLEMHNDGKPWADMGLKLEVRPGALKSMFKEMGLNTEENRAARKKAQTAASYRNSREKAKASEAAKK